jgi:predicted aspartyl protease
VETADLITEKNLSKKGIKMGLTTVKVKVTNPANLRQFFETEVLVDTGALYSVIPKSMLEKLQIKPIWKKRFILGDKIERDGVE